MIISNHIKDIIRFYESENPGVKTNLIRILSHGKVGGTGKLLVLPVDQGLEHGPTRSFAKNPDSYDPHYHFQLAIDGGFSAFAAPIGMLEAGASTYAGSIPLILKINSSIALSPRSSFPDQVVTSCIKDALRLGCVAIGLTIYPGSHNFFSMVREVRSLITEAKSSGLAVVIWSYPRGEDLSKQGETAIDTVAYAAHIAASLGAHIIKVKLPTSHIEKDPVPCDVSSLEQRVEYVKLSCFAGRRIVVFSGGESKSDEELFQEIQSIKLGKGNGSIIGRNSFQRSKNDAISMVDKIAQIYNS
ncbi:fructose-bisphosphate aldolase [Ehrlichia ruminantium]|uniref:class I fructose-bisphosphate aldolase n=1 Tax=Ehrlichia ruminantium TaxID=779 RepID=UPI0007C111FA|nr:class I fructose-bisphosphate aldolase [Ehrlichia ruminantium]QLK51992.1 class I fructose-bisphosphate aldolase [Ehrlichia ruminantium]QLK53824.1 class I fructose-bisphosphate aldolase [Ehrlichia ruminantium]QLK56577.1 class I fructose-bisphosphate aldolase [Ehrlichia ruminantium]GAT75872.1 fructose-bisphosphate aldolase [Ehrlichia ruminantium]